MGPSKRNKRARQSLDPIFGYLGQLRPGQDIPKRNAPKEKLLNFLGFSGEVRNMVYDYVFSQDLHFEFAPDNMPSFTALEPWVHAAPVPGKENVQKYPRLGADELTIAGEYDAIIEPKDYTKATVVRISKRLGDFNTVAGMWIKWKTSHYALLLVCKQISREALKMLYRKPLFAFHSAARLDNFLAMVPSLNLEAISRLHLHYNTQGSYQHPISTDQYHCYIVWYRGCMSASRKLKNLEELGIHMTLYVRPLRFNLNEMWVQPLLQFRQLSVPAKTSRGLSLKGTSNKTERKLKAVKVHIQRTELKHTLDPEGPVIVKASDYLHELFGQCLTKAILGASNDEAMAEFMEAWNGKYDEARMGQVYDRLRD